MHTGLSMSRLLMSALSRVHTYLRNGDFPALDGSWRDAMAGLRAVAEMPPDYDG